MDQISEKTREKCVRKWSSFGKKASGFSAMNKPVSSKVPMGCDSWMQSQAKNYDGYYDQCQETRKAARGDNPDLDAWKSKDWGLYGAFNCDGGESWYSIMRDEFFRLKDLGVVDDKKHYQDMVKFGKRIKSFVEAMKKINHPAMESGGWWSNAYKTEYKTVLVGLEKLKEDGWGGPGGKVGGRKRRTRRKRRKKKTRKKKRKRRRKRTKKKRR